MKDSDIVDLYWDRDESAISESKSKYGSLCRCVAQHILHNHEDAEECENDTYLRAWGLMPCARPDKLGSYLGKISRNIALGRYEWKTCAKRGGGRVDVLIEELAECVAGVDDASAGLRVSETVRLINEFLGLLSQDARIFFVQRYWYGYSDQEIAELHGCGLSRVKTSLSRSRKKLEEVLQAGEVS